MVSVVNPVEADWLENAWSSHKDGTPAINFNASGAVTLVLPEGMLAQARATGLSIEGAVSAFLGRYAPPMCSSLIDMTVAHANLKVDLLIEHPIALGDADATSQEGVADALNHALKSQPKGSVPHINRAFVVDRKPLSFSIDYVPEHKAHCVEPPDVNF